MYLFLCKSVNLPVSTPIPSFKNVMKLGFELCVLEGKIAVLLF
jgi:hypothetical protein